MSKSLPPLIRVSQEQSGKPLVAVLRQAFKDVSWGDIRRWIRTRRIMIDGNICATETRKLKTGEVVKVLNAPAAAPPSEHDVKIVYLDPHVVVVEKPSGVTSVRHAEEQQWSAKRKQFQPTLEDMLPRVIARCEKGRKSGGGSTVVRAVHRLDRETSGLMVFARTVKAEKFLGEQFRKHTTHRRYLAVVCGHVEARRIESRLIRDRGDGRRGSTSSQTLGKKAVTHIKPLENLGDYTFIECRLETGRTHQIRIHLAELGHPVCGEMVYHKQPHREVAKDKSGTRRLALHAAELGFIHPSDGGRNEYQVPLPPDLLELVEKLRGESRK